MGRRIHVDKDEKGYYIDPTTELLKFIRTSSKHQGNGVFGEIGVHGLDAVGARPGRGESKDTSEDSDGPDDISKSKAKTYAEAREDKEKWLALQAELDYRKDAGELIPADKVKRQWETIAIKVQKAMLAIPARVSAILAAEADDFKVRQLLVKEINSSLSALASDVKLASAE